MSVQFFSHKYVERQAEIGVWTKLSCQLTSYSSYIINAKDVIVLANEVPHRCIVSQLKQFENSNNCGSYLETSFFHR